MQGIKRIERFFEDGADNSVIKEIFDEDKIDTAIQRYAKLAQWAKDLFNEIDQAEARLFSTPGRTEIGGNHTDHNHGNVLAGSIHLDSAAIAFPTMDNVILIYSSLYNHPFTINIGDLEIHDKEFGHPNALIRGVAAGIKKAGYEIGGFSACVDSLILPGSGLSSSASIEILIGTMLNTFYNGSSIPIIKLAQIGRYAENNFFNKPCGLMDQIACGFGGIVHIDFENIEKPEVIKIDVDFKDFGYDLLIVNCGGSHADLTPDYAAVPEEMKQVASYFDRKVLREVPEKDFFVSLPSLRKEFSDRAILRAIHFFEDNRRVIYQKNALLARDIKSFLALIRESGASSWQLLQNCYSPTNIREQGIPIALRLSQRLLGRNGACRVHGGGFAGTIQIYTPCDCTGKVIQEMINIFGENAISTIKIRKLPSTFLV